MSDFNMNCNSDLKRDNTISKQLNPIKTNLAIIKEPVNWHALQMNWLIILLKLPLILLLNVIDHQQ